jgi:DNA recombination protein RmuC
MSFEVVVVVLVLVLGFGVLYVLLKKQQPSSAQLEAIVDRAFGMSAQRVAEQSKHILTGERAAIEVVVKQLQQELNERQREIRALDQERIKSFGELSEGLKAQREMTQELRGSTEKLRETLSNNQLRGGWGERIIEDLLRANGLVESVHYVRQRMLGSSSMKPDISLLLPDKRVIAVDVKFPYSEMQKLFDADSTVAKNAHRKQFANDVKSKVDTVAKYIAPEHNTLDYATLFVPNEMIFSFINQQFPELVDDAVAKRVLLVSPFTFLIVARTVMESYRNFLIGDKLRAVVTLIDDFSAEWSKFHESLGKYGKSLTTLQGDYEKLMGTRVRQMEKKMHKVQQLNSGSLQIEKIDV